MVKGLNLRQKNEYNYICFCYQNEQNVTPVTIIPQLTEKMPLKRLSKYSPDQIYFFQLNPTKAK